MAGRFTARRFLGSAPPSPPTVEESPPIVPGGEPAAEPEGMSFVRSEPDPGKDKLPAEPANSLRSDKLLDAKVRLHRKLIEEINLSALEKLPEDEMRQHIQQLVTQYIVVERLALNTQELNDFVSEILDEMTGLCPLE